MCLFASSLSWHLAMAEIVSLDESRSLFQTIGFPNTKFLSLSVNYKNDTKDKSTPLDSI
jgi:hypothetical protein